MKKVFGQLIPKKNDDNKSWKKNTSSENQPVCETFRNDYNILNVHAKILNKIKEDNERLESLTKQYNECEKIRQTSKSVMEVNKAKLKIQELILEINNIGSREKYYMSVSEPIIEKYKDLVKTKIPKRFGKVCEIDENTVEREKLIVYYLSIAKQIIDINVILSTPTINTCVSCSIELSPGVTACPNCSVINEDFDMETYYKDADRCNLPGRSSYIKSDHIIDSFIEFQGKQENKIPKEILEDINNTIKSYNIKLNDVTIDSVYKILKDKKYNDYYNDVYLIYNIITGKPLPDLEYIKEELYEDARKFAEIYPIIKPPNRSNCLTAHFIRDAILKRHGVSFAQWQCTYLRTSNAIQNHNDVMKRAFEVLNWGEFVPI